MYKCSVMTSSYKDTSLLEEERKRERESHQQQVLYQQCNQEQEKELQISTTITQRRNTNQQKTHIFGVAKLMTMLEKGEIMSH